MATSSLPAQRGPRTCLINDSENVMSSFGSGRGVGLRHSARAGDQFAVVESEARAREITEYRIRKRRETLGSVGTARTLEQMMQQLKEAGRKEFPLVVKADVQGSVEAIIGSLKKISTDEVEARIIHAGVGGITESDVTLAQTAGAVVIGFNVRANAKPVRRRNARVSRSATTTSSTISWMT